MPTKGMNRERFRKLTAMFDSPSRAEAITAFNLALDELAKEQDARFSVEYSIGTPDAEEAGEEMARIRAQLADALESAARHETTTKNLEETIERLHQRMASVDDHFQPASQPDPSPSDPIEFYRDPGNDDLTVDTGQASPVHSGLFFWVTVGAWAYVVAAAFWLGIVCLEKFSSPFFLPLLFVLGAIPAFLYLRKVREVYGWIGVAVKVCLTADLLLVLMVLLLTFDRVGYPHLTTREQVFSFIVCAGSLWFLYSERFLSWVLDERKRTHSVIVPGAVFMLLLGIAWVTASDTKPVKAQGHPQTSGQPPHVRKPHAAPKPIPPPDDPPKTLLYDFELPARNTSSPVLLETSYSSTTERPHLEAIAFQTSTSSDFLSGGVTLYFLAIVVFAVLKLMISAETKKQRQRKYQKSLDEANAPLPQNETGNARLASAKELKKRGWA